MQEIIEFNRNTLNSVDKWINKDDWNIPKSIFNYGLPPCIFHLIDLPLNQDITEVDMICNYMLDFSQKYNKINYLEIGVSVGKTFYQIVNFSKRYLDTIENKSFSCIDIEKINPKLELLLDNMYDNKILTKIDVDSELTNSIRKNDNNFITKWNNNITYYESDEFDKNIWKNMGINYNIIFSDALHHPDALLTEYNNIKQNKLLDKEGFIYCFDDLEDDKTYPMWLTVIEIYNDVKKTFPLLKITLEHFVVNGWIGQHEHKHNFGVIKAV
jgi:hypothetical protein